MLIETSTFPMNTILYNLAAQGTKQVNNIKKAEIQINTGTNICRSCPSKVIT